MEIFESLFKKIYSHLQTRASLQHQGVIRLENVTDYCLTLFVAMSGRNDIQICASKSFVGLQGERLILPEKIDFFEDDASNLDLYKLLVLLVAGSECLSKTQSSRPAEIPNNMDPISERLFTLKRIPEVNRYLDRELSSFIYFQSDLKRKIRQRLSFGKRYSIDEYNLWEQYFLSRSEIDFDWSYLKWKKNEIVPDFLWFTLPCSNRVGKVPLVDSKMSRSDSKNGSGKSEKEKKHTAEIEYVNLELEKKNENPVTHSFEKLETADEYNGGFRTTDSTDQLDEHGDALDEINISKVTRDGEGAQSIFRAEMLSSIGSENGQITSEEKVEMYPEWFSRERRYRSDYCKLIFAQAPIDFSKSGLEKDSFFDLVQNRHLSEVVKRRAQIQSYLNHRSWLRGLAEGSEIDINGFVRDMPAIKMKSEIEGRWFESRSKTNRSLDVAIVFDQSMSADSWIDGHRVLDLILEAMIFVGLSFDGVIESVSVSGTWSSSRHHCHLVEYKGFAESWQNFYLRLGQIKPQGYTRLGPALRHTKVRLCKKTAKKKAIIFITDGKPTDVDGYEGVHGIDDIRQACREAEAVDIKVVSLAISSKAESYFGKMFTDFRCISNVDRMSFSVYSAIESLLKD